MQKQNQKRRNGSEVYNSLNYLFYSLDSTYETEFLNSSLERAKLDFRDAKEHAQAVRWLEEDDRLRAAGEKPNHERELESIQINERMRENRLNEFEIRAREVISDRLFQRRNQAWWLYWIGTFVGVLLIATGIYFWYIRVQKPQDEFLKSQIGST